MVIIATTPLIFSDEYSEARKYQREIKWIFKRYSGNFTKVLTTLCVADTKARQNKPAQVAIMTTLKQKEGWRPVAAAGGFCLPFSNYDTEVAEAGHGLEESTFRIIVDFQAEENFKINA